MAKIELIRWFLDGDDEAFGQPQPPITYCVTDKSDIRGAVIAYGTPKSYAVLRRGDGGYGFVGIQDLLDPCKQFTECSRFWGPSKGYAIDQALQYNRKVYSFMTWQIWEEMKFMVMDIKKGEGKILFENWLSKKGNHGKTVK